MMNNATDSNRNLFHPQTTDAMNAGLVMTRQTEFPEILSAQSLPGRSSLPEATLTQLAQEAVPILPPAFTGAAVTDIPPDLIDLLDELTRQLNQTDNSLSTARNLGTLSGTRTYQDWVGDSDANDYYQLSVGDRSTFNLTLSNLTADADVQLLNRNGAIVQTSSNSNTAAESIRMTLDAGTYYIRVYPYSGSTQYTLNLSATAAPLTDWFSQNLRDASLTRLIRELAADGELSRNDMIAILRDTEDGRVVDGNEFGDLKTILNNRTRFSLLDSVYSLSNKVVNGDTANLTSRIGNLTTGSDETQMEQLIGKWFLGNDLPNTEYTYRYTQGELFQNGISYQDVRQGKVGDCYLMAALGATAFAHLLTWP
jgi:Bacterial pre-peptidase C-terminal domain